MDKKYEKIKKAVQMAKIEDHEKRFLLKKIEELQDVRNYRESRNNG